MLNPCLMYAVTQSAALHASHEMSCPITMFMVAIPRQTLCLHIIVKIYSQQSQLHHQIRGIQTQQHCQVLGSDLWHQTWCETVGETLHRLAQMWEVWR